MGKRPRSREKLDLYLFGSTKGESVVLRFPGEKWAVIDCYATSLKNPKTNATHALLKSKSVTHLEFVCLTHPHDDHFRGLSQVLRDFDVDRFWGFGGLTPPDFDLLKRFFDADARTSKSPDTKEKAKELSQIFEILKSKGIDHRVVTPTRQIYPYSIDESSNVKIWGLAPSDRHVTQYRTCLLKSMLNKGREFRSALPEADHNLVSSAFLLEFGRTRLLLGGDVEKEGWQVVLDERPSQNLSASLVKVPHHGSNNGYCRGLWDSLAAAGKPIAVLTPYVSQGLPKSDALDHILAKSSEIHSAAALAHEADSFPTPSNKRLLRIRSYLVAKAEARVVDASKSGGCCHLTCDADRNIQIEHIGDSGKIA